MSAWARVRQRVDSDCVEVVRGGSVLACPWPRNDQTVVAGVTALPLSWVPHLYSHSQRATMHHRARATFPAIWHWSGITAAWVGTLAGKGGSNAFGGLPW